MLSMILDGGLPALGIVATFLAAVPLLAFEARTRDRTRFPGLHAGLVAVLAACGVGGFSAGMALLLDAASHVSSDLGYPLLVQGVRYAVIPIVLAAGALGVLAPALLWPRGPSVVRPARAVPWVTAAAAVAACASAGAGGMVLFEVGRTIQRSGDVAFAAAQASAWADLGAAAGLVAAVLGLLNVAMGLIGGHRGLRA